MIRCQRCNRTAEEAPGYLARVNDFGVPGVWECRPACGKATAGHPILEALTEGRLK